MGVLKTINPLEELKKGTAAPNQNDALAEVKLLLDGNQAEEIQALRNIGLDKHIKIAEAERENLIKFKTAEEKFTEMDVISAESIQALCVKFRLFVNRASAYNGTIPPDLGAVIVRMNKKYNLGADISASYMQERFFVIAPPEMFKDYLSMGKKINMYYEAQNELTRQEREERARRIAAQRLDPILLYKDPESGLFIVLKKWGNDFTAVRRIKGFLTQTNFLPKALAVLNIAMQSAILVALGIFLITANILPTDYGFSSLQNDQFYSITGNGEIQATNVMYSEQYESRTFPYLLACIGVLASGVFALLLLVHNIHEYSRARRQGVESVLYRMFNRYATKNNVNLF